MDAVQGSVEQQRKQLIENIRTLPANLLQEVANEITRLQKKESDSKVKQFSVPIISSPYEAFKESGFIGCGEGPSDLAANHKKYLEEGWQEKYGESMRICQWIWRMHL